ncbi:hypothetical protein [Streptomyces triticirhizae]|uniref:Uncharacterized protein n=1 Tax=Streptomyces triticirhizae TaxID=2483353 RepID=A0A3M2M4Q5_9ACTN|nr:hypothetical protein [Streptomyces triticirhizae]RMI44452.1 hypothetical protein EBN88_05475 [Streptomyces triticirhizae]
MSVDAVAWSQDREVWHKQPGESARDHELYLIYQGQGAERSLDSTTAEWNAQVASGQRRNGKTVSVRTVERASVRWGWVARAAARDDREYSIVARRYRLRDAEQRAKNADLLGRVAERVALLTLEASMDDARPADLLRATGDLVERHARVTAPTGPLVSVQAAASASAQATAEAADGQAEEDAAHGRDAGLYEELLEQMRQDVAAVAQAPAVHALPAAREEAERTGLVDVLAMFGDDDAEEGAP